MRPVQKKPRHDIERRGFLIPTGQAPLTIIEQKAVTAVLKMDGQWVTLLTGGDLCGLINWSLHGVGLMTGFKVTATKVWCSWLGDGGKLLAERRHRFE